MANLYELTAYRLWTIPGSVYLTHSVDIPEQLEANLAYVRGYGSHVNPLSVNYSSIKWIGQNTTGNNCIIVIKQNTVKKESRSVNLTVATQILVWLLVLLL